MCKGQAFADIAYIISHEILANPVLKKKYRTPDTDVNTSNQVGREVKGKNHTYYQVLIDSRDCPHIVSI